MIICASRRTDIPAFHSEWLMNRLRERYALVRNPIAKDVVYRVDLSPNNIDILLLMTKDPRPMIPLTEDILEMGIKVGFQVSITPYGKDIEPGVPDKADVASAFREISDMVGKEAMIWRYDPVIINDKFTIAYHKRRFKTICNELSGYTQRCIFSFVDIYDKLKRFSDSETLRKVSLEEAEEFGSSMSEISKDAGIELSICCSEFDLSKYGISSRGCIDRDQMRSLNVPFEELQTPIREGCRCVRNIDIGEYDTCRHDCIYCYANRNTNEARNKKVFDPHGEMLYGKLRTSDKIVELSSRKNSKITDF